MGRTLQYIVEEVCIHEHQRVLFAVVVNSGPHRDELLFNFMQLMLRLQQIVDDKGGERLTRVVSRYILVHELLNAHTHLIIVHQLGAFQ